MSFYHAAPRDSISQGDIFHLTPSAYVKPPVELVDPSRTFPGGVQASQLSAWSPDSVSPVENAKATMFMTCGRAILLSHDCEIDNDNRYRLVALLRPLRSLPAGSQSGVRDNTDYRFFYLPELSQRFDELYIDFRRLTTVGPKLIPAERRLASLSDVARAALCLQMILFFTRRMLTGADLQGALVARSDPASLETPNTQMNVE